MDFPKTPENMDMFTAVDILFIRFYFRLLSDEKSAQTAYLHVWCTQKIFS